jgi:hypothetical protein
MSENFTKSHPSLERRISECTSALDLANLLHEIPVGDVLQGSTPAPAMPARPVGTALRAKVEGPDGRYIIVSADSWRGIDLLTEGVKNGQITSDIW